ncbi:MAG: hypothetical protein M3N50_05665 [Pseudomonadota bacterium]|nr:hypothetical protein [Pseudomonadota bacterium]
MHSSSSRLQPYITTLSLVLLLVALWLLMRGYPGLTGDAQIYAFQALARLHPPLATDLYLQNTSQDQFTIFSPLYAWAIGAVGLENAARLLTLIFTTWLLAAAWSFAGAIVGREAAWLAVGFLLIVAGDYGGAGVFRFSEAFLTARLPAEALVITALACHVRGMQRMGLLLAMAALFIHPLIALPGLLLVIGLRLPNRVNAMAAAAGLVAILCLAFAAALFPDALPAFAIMHTDWLEVVRERSQFLFLQLWSFHDWNVNARLFIYLGFAAVVVQDARLRKLCAATALVAAAGLALALIASLIGPVAILLQGQAWRWVWIAVFVGALLLPITVLQVWRDERCGPLCAILLVAGWTFPAVDGTACVSLALSVWVMRTHISIRGTEYCRWTAVVLSTAIGLWILVKSGAVVSSTKSSAGHVLLGAMQIRDIFGMRISAVFLAALAWWFIRNSRTLCRPMLLAGALLALSIFILPAAFKQSRWFGAASDVDEFAAWAHAIPATSSVLVTPEHDAGAFVWFTLHRPNYLALNQSAGVVFSRATSLEVKRRSEVLLPLMEPSWKILAGLRSSAAAKRQVAAKTRPLTAENLRRICADAQLGFVISPQNVGFDPLRHDHPGAWHNWNLYDCRKVRSPLPLA